MKIGNYNKGAKGILLILLLLAMGVLQAGDPGFSECGLTHPRLSRVINAQCRDFEVPLNHGEPQGEKIRLHVAVIPASGKAPDPDPLFFFAGGPGQSAVDSAPLMWPVFSQLVKQRDIVLIDQRGTGKSTPLDCPQDDELDLLADDDLLVQKTRECLDSLAADVRFFTSRQAVEDVAFVREALGYEQINLMGVSYGTRMAQLVLREYPGTVRSIVLDGVIPLETVIGVDFAASLQQSMQKLLLNCGAGAACSKAFPDLDQDWHAYLQLPVDETRQLEIAHPRTGEMLKLEVDRQSLDAALRMLSYSSETRSLLPLLIHTVVEGNWLLMLGQALQVVASLDGEMSEGMHNAVVCTEDVPYYENLPPPSNKVLGRFPQQIQKLCSVWPRGESYPDIHRPLQSAVPALLLSGELDPVTPVSYGEQALKQFSSGQHLVVPGQAHNVLPRGCVPQLAADFIGHLALEPGDSTCVQDTAHLPFFIDKLGPAP
ncbi:MAG TPA: alpha/beta fold hydrolase [Chromatiaceae bacterium]|nr:alpha/beta fold hydrolase [Chromatiaceae bacterium]